jgi:hypothetical protein
LNTKQNKLEISIDDSEIAIEKVSVDGVSDSRPFNKPEVSLLLEPEAKSVELTYRKINFSPKLKENVPVVRINSKAGNINTIVNTNKPTWLLWLDGSSWGPAVLIWSKVVASILIMLALRYLSMISINLLSLVLMAFALSLMPTIVLPIPLLWIALVRESRIKTLMQEKCPKYINISAGNSSTLMSLKWYSDFCGATNSNCILPTPWILSLPMFYWRGLTLFISLFIMMFTVKLVKETAQIVRGGD